MCILYNLASTSNHIGFGSTMNWVIHFFVAGHNIYNVQELYARAFRTRITLWIAAILYGKRRMKMEIKMETKIEYIYSKNKT